MSVEKIIIVGGVAGGATAAARARRLNEHAQIVVFEKDGYPSFANCGLPYYLGGEITDRSKLLVAPVELLRERFRLDVRVYSEVVAIDREAHTVEVVERDGQTQAEMRRYTESYDRLILATGAAPIVPPIEGVAARGVFTLRNLEDTDAIDAWLKAPHHPDPLSAVIVGGGYIGLEMAEQMHHRGFKVTLVERAPQILTLIDPEMAEPVESEMRDEGIDLRLNAQVASVRADEKGDVSAAVLKDGSELPCDMLIFGIGVRPSIGLARNAGIEIGQSGGIATDQHMRTSDPDIYAVGDAAEYPYAPTGSRMRVPLAGPANRAGRIAGQHAASGDADPMPPVMGTAVARVFSYTVGLTGLSLAAAQRRGIPATAVTVITAHHVGYYPGASPITLKLVYQPGDGPEPGRILGAQAIGKKGVDKRIDVIATAMRFGATVRDLAGVDLCYAPPYGAAKDPVHMAAFAACNDLDGLVDVTQPDADLAGLQVVDVRSKAEVEKNPLPGTRQSDLHHIPLDDLREQLHQLDPDRPTVTSCASGVRSYNAARILLQHGFKQVANLSGAATLRGRAARKNEGLTTQPAE